MKKYFSVFTILLLSACATPGSKDFSMSTGVIAPDFSLPDHRGEMITLSRILSGHRWAVIAFYPKDDSRN